jgi:hypothetical protein
VSAVANIDVDWLTYVTILCCINRHHGVFYFKTAGYNQLSGTIPPELGRLTDLVELDLGKLKMCFPGAMLVVVIGWLI